ncbi:hypothetical protein V2G26_008372 [Clonostachys chloroleuca]
MCASDQLDRARGLLLQASRVQSIRGGSSIGYVLLRHPGHHHLDVRDVRGILSQGACVCLQIGSAAYAYRPLLISTGRMTGRETGAFLSRA